MRIRGLGVIADATVPLAPGFTVVTGETGAGKTMVVAGLGLLFGGRGDASRVRAGSAYALVEGRLRLPAGDRALIQAIEAGAETDEDGCLLVSRTVSAEGRSRAHAGGRSVPAGLLASLGQELLTVHGQAEQMRLLKPVEQRSALDRFAGAEVSDLLDRHRKLFAGWRARCDDLAERTAHARERGREAALLEHGLAEIAAVDPQPSEDERLRAEALRLEHVDALRQASALAHQALAGNPVEPVVAAPDVLGLIAVAQRALADAGDADPTLTAYAARLAELSYLAADVAGDLASYTEGLDIDPARLDVVHERRASLATLTRRYADTVDGVLAWARDAGQRLAALDSSAQTLAALAAERDDAAAELAVVTAALTAARRRAADSFAEAVTAELAGLAMPDARVRALVSDRPPGPATPGLVVDGKQAGVGADGADDVELLLTPHRGGAELPIQRGASGGELSRIMLAVEVVLADDRPLPTMVFDEVDAGVGGRAAVEVGRRLARLAVHHQVLAVTHLPQVAAYADTHLVVDKDSDGAVTESGVRVVTGTDRGRELARMLAGLDTSELGLAHAEELLATAGAHRTADRAADPAADSGGDPAGEPARDRAGGTRAPRPRRSRAGTRAPR